MLAMRSSISRSAADGGRGSGTPDVAPSGCGAAPARLHPLLLPMLPPVCTLDTHRGEQHAPLEDESVTTTVQS